MENEVETAQKKKHLDSIGKIILGIILLISIFIASLVWDQYGDRLMRIGRLSPNPEISSSQCNDNSTLGNVAAQVDVSVINRGQEGEIVIEAKVTQGQGSWTKTEILFLTKNQTGNVRIPFDEVTFGGGDIQCFISAYAN